MIVRTVSGERQIVGGLRAADPPGGAWWAGATAAIRRRRAPVAFLTGAAVAAALLVTVGLRLVRVPATAGEAGLAAATSTTAGVPGLGGTGWPDTVAAHQLAVPALLLDGGQPVAVLDAARAATLAFLLVASLLVWPIARRLGFSPAGSAAASALCAVGVGLIGSTGVVDAGAVAIVWLAMAALFALADPGSAVTRTAAAAAAGLAVLTAPVAGVGLLVLGGHLVGVSAIAPTLRPRPRRLLAGAAVAAAVVLVVLATGHRPLALQPTSAVPVLGTVLVIVGLGLVLAAAWVRLDWLRPVCTAAAAVLACGLVPGTGIGTVAVLVVPVVAVAAVALLDRALPDGAPPAGVGAGRSGLVLAAVGVLGLLAAALPVAFGGSGEPGASAGTLSRWVSAELDPAVPIVADGLDGAQLARDGVPVGRLRAPGSAQPGAVIVLSERPGAGPGGDPAGELAAQRAGTALLARFPDGPGHAAAEVRTPVADLVSERADRIRFGVTLAGNPALQRTANATAALRAGLVDPRLMTVLAALTASHRVTIAELPAVTGEPADAPLRTAVITAFDGAATADPATAFVLTQWLAGQRPPYAPSVTHRPGEPVAVSFPAPSPLGLLPG